jgi:plastocyanin
MIRPALLGFLLLLLGAIFGALSLIAPARAATHNVDVGDNFFAPESATISVGDEVTWTWTGFGTHSVVADGGAFVSSVAGNGASFSFTFNAPGTYEYYCSIHSTADLAFMNGSITVQGASPSSTPQTSDTPVPATNTPIGFTPEPTTEPGDPTNTPIGTTTPPATAPAAQATAADPGATRVPAAPPSGGGGAAPGVTLPATGGPPGDGHGVLLWLSLSLAGAGLALIAAAALHRTARGGTR